MPKVDFDRYYRYAELTELLRAFQSEHPDLVKLSSIGQSYEGRDIWMLTVTDSTTGEAQDKPGFWCDGNIHASEVSASTAVLAILHKLVTDRPAVLQTRAFYLVPRLNPDGAEWALETPPRIIRSSTRPWPYDEEDPYGLERKDLDGDGRILNMRVKDPNGPWKIAEEEPRLMKRREPGETGGTYYRLLPEGELHDWDGVTLRPRMIKEGLDLNRNFPSAWRPEAEQHGAGAYPTSEPEVRAQVEAISRLRNVCGVIAFHTFSGVLLRPPSRMPDDDIPSEDLWTYKALGEKGKQMTGYPAISNFHEFKYHPKEVITGVSDDWAYEHMGVYAWTVEIWSPQRQAGITDYKYIDWFRDHPFEDDLKLLAWSDEKLGGLGHVGWKPFQHPQLGEVEIGGWDGHYAFRNPPPPFLESEVFPLADWAIWHAGTTPCLELREVKVEKLGEGARIRLVVQNTGWLPTSVTKQAESKNLVRGVVGEIESPGEGWLVTGLKRQQGPQLAGWNHVSAGGFGWTFSDTSDLTVFEWVVGRPGTYQLVATHDRAGTVRTTVEVN